MRRAGRAGGGWMVALGAWLIVAAAGCIGSDAGDGGDGTAMSPAAAGPAAAMGPAAPEPAVDVAGGGAGAGSIAGAGATTAAGDAGAGAATDTQAEPVVVDPSVPAGEHCAPVADWDPAWVAFEDEVLRLTNERRAQGASCGSEGSFGPAAPLSANPMLRCSARLHSQDMGEQGYFDHTDLAGNSPFTRMAEAGYTGTSLGENIAKGQQAPADVMDSWMNSPGHCSNIMNPSFTEIGIGYWEGAADGRRFNSNKLWTQNFGAPRAVRGPCPRGAPSC